MGKRPEDRESGRPQRDDPTRQVSGGTKSGSPDLSNLQIGDFLLLRRLGTGGMGEVYLAQQVSLKRRVAVKLLRENLTPDGTAQQRFAVEAEAAAKLTHSNIVQVYSTGVENGISFIALEYVQGMNLREYVSRKGPMSPKVAVRVMEQVASALQHASEAGVVHRDIKPDNILLTRAAEVKVTDFGLARLRQEVPVHLTQTGMTMGTPLYMSPEQVEGGTVDSRSDLYSLGATCYYMLAGRPPYQGETGYAVAVQHIKGNPEPLDRLRPDLPGELVRIVQKLMARDADQRYQTGRQVIRDLQKVAGELSASPEGGAMTPSSPDISASERSERSLAQRVFLLSSMRRHGRWWFAASLMLGLLGGAGYAWYCRAPDLHVHAGDRARQASPPSWEEIPKKESAEAQYKFATWAGQDVDAEAAWLAMIHYWSSEPDWALLAKAELGKLYLVDGRLDQAERHFGEMAMQEDERTRLAGMIGRAMVLSYRDRPAESQSLLWEQVRESGFGLDRKTPGGPGALADRTLLGMILWVFERNFRDLGIDWDPDVKSWANRRIHRYRPSPGSRPGDSVPGTAPRSPNGQRNPVGGGPAG